MKGRLSMSYVCDQVEGDGISSSQPIEITNVFTLDNVPSFIEACLATRQVQD